MGCFCSDGKADEPLLRTVKVPNQPVKELTIQDPLDRNDTDAFTSIHQDPFIKYATERYREVAKGEDFEGFKAKKKKREKAQLFATQSKKEYRRYLRAINKALNENQLTTTTLLGMMIEEFAEYKEREKLTQKFESTDEYVTLKCFVYLYTGDSTYRKINGALRQQKLEKVALVIGRVKEQLLKFKQVSSPDNLKLHPRGQMRDLYRGIMTADKLMEPKKKMFWRGFTSTSIQSSVTEYFGKGKFKYIIKLDSERPHDFLMLPLSFSQYPKEEEVLIFPYLYLECTEKKEAGNSLTYMVKQLHPDKQTN